MGHTHNVRDSDAHFSINPITKVIKKESSKKTTNAEYEEFFLDKGGLKDE